jgi:hypothetical protein
MKKFFVILLIFTVTQGAFAQFQWSLNSQFNTQLFSQRTPLGERAEKVITVNEQQRYNDFLEDNPNNPPNVREFGIFRGNYFYFGQNQDFFSYGRGVWTMPNQLRLTIGYKGDNVQFHTRTYLDRLVRINEFNANEGTGQNIWDPDGDDQSFIVGDGRTPNWGAILRYAFEEWYVRGTVGIFTASVGIMSDRGKVQTFNNQTEFLLRGIQVDNYGVMAPTRDADFIHDGLDTNNLLRSGAPHILDAVQFDPNIPIWNNKYTSMPYFMIAARLENVLPFPLTLQLAADPGNNIGLGSTSDFFRAHGAFRLSAEQIFGHVNFDAIYKIAGFESDTLNDFDPVNNPEGTLQPSGDGIFAHNFGVYANVLDLFGFDFGFGVSAFLRTYEDLRLKDTVDISGEVIPGALITTTSPLFMGYDLRIRYSGINRLTLTSFNNVSMATSRTAQEGRDVFGVTGMQLPINTMQEWFSMFNSFTIAWNPFDRIFVSAQIGRRYGLITTKTYVEDWSVDTGIRIDTIERSREQWGGGFFVAYRHSFFDVQIGLAFRNLFDSYSNTGTPPTGSNTQTIAGFRDASGGTFDIAIPIQLRFVF